MAEKSDDMCCMCAIILIIGGVCIVYWYIVIPFAIFVLVFNYVLNLHSIKKESTKKDVIKLKSKNYIPPEPEYSPNCVNCGMPIKTVEDLISINNRSHCKYCGTLRVKKNQKQFSLTGNYRKFGERLHPDEWYETELPDYEKNLRESLTQESFEKRSRHISSQVKREVWQRDYGRCVDCGSKERLEYDHIIPFSKGGSNTTRNIQLLCEKCNRKKHDKI